MDISKIKKWAGYIALTILVAFVCKILYWNFVSKPDLALEKNTEAMTIQHSNGGTQQRGRWGPPPYVYRGSSVVGSTGGGGYGYYYPFYYDMPVLQRGYYVEKERRESDHYSITLFAIFSTMVVFAILVT